MFFESSRVGNCLFFARNGRGSAFRLAVLLSCLAGLLLACSGAGSDGGAGSVGLFITDAPSDDFEAVNATVEKIELLGGPRGAATIFEGRETFDLLALRDASEILSFTGEVPAGRYQKIRMRLAEGGLELVSDDGSTAYPTLLADRSLDLSPGEDLEVKRGRLLAVEMDIDVDRSFESKAGAPGGYAFNPVIFARPIRNVTDGRLARLHGKLQNIDEQSQSFELCHMKRPRAWLHDQARHGERPRPSHDVGMGPGGSRLDVAQAEASIERADERHHPRLRCIAVDFAAGASIFDSNADPMDGITAELAGAEVSVAGRIHPRGEELALSAFAMWIGSRDDFDHRGGRVSGEYDPDAEEFILSQPFGRGEIIVQLSEATKLFEKGGVEVGSDAIAEGIHAGVMGILLETGAEADADILKAAVISLQLEESDGEPLRGEVLEILSERDREADVCPLQILLDTGEIEGIGLGRRTALFRNDLAQMKSAEITFADLVLGETVNIFGRPAAEGSVEEMPCYHARVIMAYAGEGGE
jgi:hypothetical protein